MIVEAQMDWMGNITVTPVNKRIRKQWAADTLQWGGETDGELFLQGDAVDEFVAFYVPKQHRHDLDNGYTVRFRMDGWVLRHMIGYCVD